MRVVHANGDEVRLAAKVEMWAEIIHERDEAVGPRAQVLAVDPDITALVYAVELKQDAASCIASRKLEGLAIPADAGRQVGSRASARLRFAEGPADAPVVRQSHRSPASAGELRGLRVGDVPLGKAPPIVEAQSALAGGVAAGVVWLARAFSIPIADATPTRAASPRKTLRVSSRLMGAVLLFCLRHKSKAGKGGRPTPRRFPCASDFVYAQAVPTFLLLRHTIFSCPEALYKRHNQRVLIRASYPSARCVRHGYCGSWRRNFAVVYT